jgi:CRP-like cAMP-binding protein
MREGAVERRRLGAGETLVEQGEPGTELYLILDGVLAAEVDGEDVAEFGPGTIVGERAVLEEGRRTASLRARTAARVVAFPAEALHVETLATLAADRGGSRE